MGSRLAPSTLLFRGDHNGHFCWILSKNIEAFLLSRWLRESFNSQFGTKSYQQISVQPLQILLLGVFSGQPTWQQLFVPSQLDMENTIKCSKDFLHVNLCQKFFFLENMGRTCCVKKLFWVSKTISVHNMFSPCSHLGIFVYWTCNSMNNLSSYCGLDDAKIRASDKDLPVVI